MNKFNYIFVFLFFTSSCSSYINSMYREFDRADKTEAKTKKDNDKFSVYRQKPKPKPLATKNPNNQQVVFSSNGLNELQPSIKRDYVPENSAKKRYKASDLVDDDNVESLWAGAGRDNYLFASDNEKRNGDIIVIDVYTKLKGEITAELKRSFPEQPTKNKKKEDGKEPASQPDQAQAATPTAPSPAAETGKVYDKISSVIIEEINKEHVLIRGRKDLLYKNHKHLVEVQALVARRDIGADDTVKSDNILESSISIVR